MIPIYNIMQEPITEGIKLLEPKFVPAACELLENYLRKFRVAAMFNKEEFAHWFLPKDGVVNAFVVEVCFQ
jgi:glycylpeptide N-tetradecanoyltransferase